MMKVNRKVEYALMALKLLIDMRPGELMSVKEVAQVTGAPQDALARVMQSLNQVGILRSEQGPKGGYQVAKDLKKVTFFDLAQAVLGPVDAVKCTKAQSSCDLISTCNVQSPMIRFNSKLLDFYKSLTVSNLLNLDADRATPLATNSDELATAAEIWQ